MKWLNIVGLVFDFAGAIIIALGVIPSRRQFDTPTAADRVRQSNLALVGLGLLIIGFLVQIIGDWPK